MKWPLALLAGVALAAFPARGGAQHFRVRMDARAQAVSFRGIESDSILAALVVPSPSGGRETPDGHAARCGAGPYCFFSRPGPVLRGVPVTTSASAVLWGLGVEGLALHATGRLVADLGRDEVWPGTEPLAQLIEGYLEYRRAAIVARAGRQLVSSRLEPIGFDGAWLRARWDRAALELTGYGGWGLGQAAVVPATSPALDPLDEWRPRDRQLVAGAEVAWVYRDVDARAEYRREIDPLDDYFVSERAAASIGARLGAIRATTGLDYNLAEARIGNADVALTYLDPRFSITVGARRYRPYFSLWTLWGAFSPVPYNAAHASAEVRPTRWLTVHARGERYRYEDADAATALVPTLEDRGWRANAGAKATLGPQVSLEASYGLEHGPGASGRFVDGSLTWTPDSRYAFDLYGGTMARPLELRYYDATSKWIGGRAQWQLGLQRRLWTDIAFMADERERPDAGASSLDQVRIRAGLSVTMGSGADRAPLPPARPLDR
jgi:hypothetical protein